MADSFSADTEKADREAIARTKEALDKGRVSRADAVDLGEKAKRAVAGHDVFRAGSRSFRGIGIRTGPGG